MVAKASDAGLGKYLQALSEQLSLTNACVAFGMSPASTKTLSGYYRSYGVTPPDRKNQYAATVNGETVLIKTQPDVPKREVATWESVPDFLREVPVGEQAAWEETLVAGDIHFPFEDKRAVRLFLAVVRDRRPARVVLNGDVADFYAISHFSKDPKRATGLQDELDAVVAFLKTLRSVAGPDCEIVLVEGNHEARMSKYLLGVARELAYLRAMDIASLLGLAELGIEYVRSVGRDAYTMVGNIAVGHFSQCNQNAGYTAMNLLRKGGVSAVQGHVHRLASVSVTRRGGQEIHGIESGCLCDTKPSYVSDPDWQQGFAVIRTLADGTQFTEAVRIQKGRCFLDGRMYEVGNGDGHEGGGLVGYEDAKGYEVP